MTAYGNSAKKAVGLSGTSTTLPLYLFRERSPWSHHREKIPTGIRIAVYERDQWSCQSCGLVFSERRDGKAPWNADGIWLEVHHWRVPYAAGGSHHPDNLKAFCTPCNNAESRKPVVD